VHPNRDGISSPDDRVGQSIDPGFVRRVDDRSNDRGFFAAVEDRSNDAGFFAPVEWDADGD